MDSVGGIDNYGGGIDNNGGILTVSNSTLSGNYAGITGGGIANFEHADSQRQYPVGQLRRGNSAKASGGGIANLPAR